jgi:hypothetical protein
LTNTYIPFDHLCNVKYKQIICKQIEGKTKMNTTEKSAALTEIVKEYAPYDTHEAFGEGFVAYEHLNYTNPYDGKRNEG